MINERKGIIIYYFINDIYLEKNSSKYIYKYVDDLIYRDK